MMSSLAREISYAPVLRGLLEDFQAFFAGEVQAGTDATGLAEFIGRWVAEPKNQVIETTGGDFATFLQVVVIIVAQILRQPEAFFLDEPQFEVVIDFDYYLPGFLDPQRWREWVFLRQTGQSIEVW